MNAVRNPAAYCVTTTASIREAVTLMDASRMGIVLVVDARRRLLGTVTDGDVRRAFLARVDFELPIQELLDRKAGTQYAKPLSARFDGSREEYLRLLREHNLLHLPLLDGKDKVVDLITLDELLPAQPMGVQGVVMAGGKGSRLLPLTENTPKPMLRVGDKPLMEIILEQLRDSGIKQVHVSTHHQKDKIIDHFGDGKKVGLDLSYLEEDQPLGTAGALGLIEKPRETMLVMNGDVLTQVDFRAMINYHREMRAELTMAVTQYDIKVPYGVVECKGDLVSGIQEKPTLGFFVGAGIYLIEPSSLRYIPKDRKFDMTDLISRLVDNGHRVASFPIHERWLDIGRQQDYAKAQEEIKEWRQEKP